MVADELKLRTLCEIRPVELAKDDIPKSIGDVYAARILNINPDDTIDFSIPEMAGEKVDLLRNTRYSFLFIADNAGMKTAHGVFMQRIRIDNVPMARVKLVTSLKKIQRRDYFRVGCKVPVFFQSISFRKEELEQGDPIPRVMDEVEDDGWKNGLILDISGGGLKMVTEEPIINFPYMVFKFILNVDGVDRYVIITGKILSREPVPRTLLCTHRVQFCPEHSKGQDDILAFVYMHQRETAKKETGKDLERRV